MTVYPYSGYIPRKVHTGLVLFVFSALSTATTALLAEEASTPMNNRTALARPAMEWDKSGKLAKYDFDFGHDDFKAWARRDGSWNAEGPVQHKGLVCGTYTLSLRVGHGNPGCTNVKWFREPRAVAKTTLCNNASGIISGGNTEFLDVAHFDEITCAERVISCSGNCK